VTSSRYGKALAGPTFFGAHHFERVGWATKPRKPTKLTLFVA
jgi:hypothetical protein